MSHPASPSLRQIALRPSYRSGRDDLVKDLYLPCLSSSVLYRRAVGYFSSNSLALVATGINRLLANGGRMQLVASPHLSEEDVQAIRLGYQQRQTLVLQRVSEQLQKPEELSEATQNRLNGLAWLIANGKLEIRLAIPVDPITRQICGGLYHEKIGIFEDALGDRVAFTGSANETAGGLMRNFESVDAFVGWNDPEGRVEGKLAEFGSLWNNRAEGVESIAFPEVGDQILRLYKRKMPPEDEPMQVQLPESPLCEGDPCLPKTLKLRPHQIEAQASWFANGKQGTLQMATGSGKTITALSILTQCFEQEGLQAVLILCPYIHLVGQWADECRRFGLDPLPCCESRARWEDELEICLANIQNGQGRFLCVISTNTTFALPHFQRLLAQFPKRSLIVADECHNLGAPQLQRALPKQIPWRLALSATPERWFDDEGTAAIFGYFGNKIPPEYTLKQALKDGVLCPYTYHPILVDLTEEEATEYAQLTTRIARLAGDEDDRPMKALLLKRARLMGSAQNKLKALDHLAEGLEEEAQLLFYCGDGRTQDPTDQIDKRQIEAVSKCLSWGHQMRVSTYTAETTLEERHRLSEQLASGKLQGIVAIRCLDEGVDIPSVRTAVILASSTNPRQFIQRRGRILRRAPGKDMAVIHDMIVCPPPESLNEPWERRMLKKELTRVAEFADLAHNAAAARQQLLPLQRRYGLLDV